MQCNCGCGGQALYSYVWAWGESGVCCERKRFVLGQQSERLRRACTITPLDPGAPSPVSRDERVTYNARILALQDELTELQARSLNLTEGNRELARQLQTESSARAVVESELQASRERFDDMSAQLAESERARLDAQTEVDRLTGRLAAYDLSTDPLDVPPGT